MATLDLGKVTGENGQGVASGGTAGQLLKKASSSNYDTAWVSPDTAPTSASGNPITSGAVYGALGTTQGAIAIMSDNNTHAVIASGDFVYVRNHGTLAEGLYQATANISQNGTLSTSNLTAVSGGGLNALNKDIMDKAKRTNYTVAGSSSSAIPIPSNTRAFIVTSGTAGTQKSMIILSASSGGSVAYTLVCQGNDVSYNDASSNQLIVTNGNNNALAVTVFFMNV